MPCWYYFSRPSHLAYHDFTRTIRAPRNIRSLLGLGLKFIPTPKLTNRWSHINPLPRFRRAIHLKFYFGGPTDNEETDDEYNPRMYLPSSWTPPHWTRPPRVLEERLSNFDSALKKLFLARTGKTNLLPHQHRALASLQRQSELLVAPCDKNLGPAIIERSDYLDIAFRDHLNDRTTYKPLTPAEATTAHWRLDQDIEAWLRTHHKSCTKMERRFLREHLKQANETPFARFYLTLKAHKLKPGQNVNHLKSRPIVSCPGSLLHPLGIWTDHYLQQVARIQPSYFKDSFTLREIVSNITIPPNALLFTADAVSMYTNIPTATAIPTISRLLRQHKQQRDNNYPLDAVKDALNLIMRNNIFTFGDCTFKQLNGTAMGTPPAPPYATLYYAAHEDRFVNRWSAHLIFYKRFIDDVFGIWLPHPNHAINNQLWLDFQAHMNQARGLVWEFSELSERVNFMDLTITLSNGIFHTTLYEKPLNLHLYIPPHSAHPPGLLPGIIHGTLFRIYRLCSDEADQRARILKFYHRLQLRGYKKDKLDPIFTKAINKLKQQSGQRTDKDTSTSVILHLPFHPQDPASRDIQRLWRNTIAKPPYKMAIGNLKNPQTNQKCNINRMIIAYRRPMNLGNLLSHRNFDTNTGPPVSSFLNTDD